MTQAQQKNRQKLEHHMDLLKNLVSMEYNNVQFARKLKRSTKVTPTPQLSDPPMLLRHFEGHATLLQTRSVSASSEDGPRVRVFQMAKHTINDKKKSLYRRYLWKDDRAARAEVQTNSTLQVPFNGL